MYIAYLGAVGMLGSKEGMNPGALSFVPLPAFVQYLPCTGVLAKLNFWVLFVQEALGSGTRKERLSVYY